MRVVSKVVLGCMLVGLAGNVAAQSAPRKIVGDVVAYQAGVLQVRTASGAQESMRLSDPPRISVRGQSDVAHIKPGDFVATTAAPRADGTLVASELRIFPESMRGRGEGHRPMTGANTMTNATVASVSRASGRPSETSATVGAVTNANGEATLKVTYKGGDKIIVVPPTTPVMTTDEGTPAVLVPGAHVLVYASTQPDGSLVAERLSVGKGNYVPPL
jgi:hypothetical protein